MVIITITTMATIMARAGTANRTHTARPSGWRRTSSPRTTAWPSAIAAGLPAANLRLNLMSAPGAGKTTLLERTISDLGRELLAVRDRRRPGNDQ